jgi:hypothetical protein
MAASAEDSGVWAVGMEEGRAWWRGMWQAENLERLVALEKMRLLLMEQNLRQSALVGLRPHHEAAKSPSPNPHRSTRLTSAAFRLDDCAGK